MFGTAGGVLPRTRRLRHGWLRRVGRELPGPLASVILPANPVPLANLLSQRWAPAVLLTLTLALVAQRLGAVTRQGAIAGAASTLLLFLGGGAGAFAGLATVFLLTWLSTRWGYERKLRLGVAEKRQGRSARQVLANTAVAAALAGVALLSASPILWLVAATAALAEAAADTVSSELGQAAGGRTLLVTNLRAVAPGTNGGVSLTGTLAGMLAASTVAAACAAFGMVTISHAAIAAGAAVLGMFADSLLGATLEPRGVLTNNGVNLAGTLAAAGIAFAICNL